MKTTSYFLIIIFSCLSLLSCIKEKKKVYVPVDADLQAHYNFKPGSYWIYRDSATGIEDSFLVTQYRVDTVQAQQDKNKYYYNVIISDFIQQFHNNILIDTANWSVSLESTAFLFGNSGVAVQFDLKDVIYLDTIFQGIEYQKLRKYKI